MPHSGAGECVGWHEDAECRVTRNCQDLVSLPDWAVLTDQQTSGVLGLSLDTLRRLDRDRDGPPRVNFRLGVMAGRSANFAVGFKAARHRFRRPNPIRRTPS